ncbi:unnamed protein product [Adineta ricciae]|uniref:Uncharacterized protein n=2 Tax=Adineta ricciae TaxID=249248 RepID=A0A813XPW1_ADIRI|nr:unnamed protein product [Adineta ricciae]
MFPTTYVHYTDADGNGRIKTNNIFGTGTSLYNVAQWILQWLKGTYAFDIQIWSPNSSQWLDFDDDYINQQGPYGKQSEVHLKVLRTSDGRFRNSALATRKYQAPSSVLVNYTNPTISFIRDIHAEQRDEDRDKKSTIKSDTGRNPIFIKVKIMCQASNAASPSAYNILVFLVWEVCDKGVRTLYYHPYRKLVNDLNDEAYVTIVPTTDMFGQGVALDVSTKGIPGSKTGGKNPEKHLFCHLENRLHQETTYETSRLACLLTVNGDPLWRTLALSKPTIFTKSYYTVEERNVLDCDGQVVETVRVQIFKRKRNLNQCDTVPQCPDVTNRKVSKKRVDNNSTINSLIHAGESSPCSTGDATIQGLPVTWAVPPTPQNLNDQYQTVRGINQPPEQLSPHWVAKYLCELKSKQNTNAPKAVAPNDDADQDVSPNSSYITLSSGYISQFIMETNTDQSDIINNRTVSQTAPFAEISDRALIIPQEQLVNGISLNGKKTNTNAPGDFQVLHSWFQT